ncbi:hypothetical protein [Anatilimnocola floriformis]|uniref:hypothetical protein n=1 Tax=Anatilimnocola floriformis TaxID=2948575 RepID=UPI0020C22F81|nr:hypothetical protein [Anatilimnocola floriformis]
MKPNDFLVLATKLHRESVTPPATATKLPDPATMRTSVSRAYYAAFLTARVIMETEWRQPEFVGGNEHRLLQQCLLNSNVPEAYTIGKLLENLHDSRKSADYDLNDVDMDTAPNAAFCIERATDIIELLKQCSTGVLSAQIRAGITQYRRMRQV